MLEIIIYIVLITIFLFLFFLFVRWLYQGTAKKMNQLSIGQRVVILERFSDTKNGYYLLMLDNTGEIMLFKDRHSYDKGQSHLFLWDGKRLKPCY